jgi:tRNA-Thr(GGU) m(6)t(6)A37 methyltransferase TsaA
MLVGVSHVVEPVGVVCSDRTDPRDTDHWGSVVSTIRIDERFPTDCLLGLEEFSHVEVLFVFDRAQEHDEYHARPARGRADLPAVGVFAGRGPRRPNRIGATICQVLSAEGRVLTVRGLDAVDGTPVIDIKPVLTQFLPTGVRQPAWVDALMAEYFVDRPE